MKGIAFRVIEMSTVILFRHVKSLLRTNIASFENSVTANFSLTPMVSVRALPIFLSKENIAIQLNFTLSLLQR